MSRRSDLIEAEERREQKQAFRIKHRLMARNYQVREDVPMITELRVKLPEVEGGDHLIIVKGHYQGKNVVAFHGGGDPVTALDQALTKWDENRLRWREDTFTPTER